MGGDGVYQEGIFKGAGNKQEEALPSPTLGGPEPQGGSKDGSSPPHHKPARLLYRLCNPWRWHSEWSH